MAKKYHWDLNKIFSDLRGFLLNPREDDYVPEYKLGVRGEIVSEYKRQVSTVSNIIKAMKTYADILERSGDRSSGTVGLNSASKFMSERILIISPSKKLKETVMTSLINDYDKKKFRSLSSVFAGVMAVGTGIYTSPQTGKNIGCIFGIFGYDFIKKLADRELLTTILFLRKFFMVMEDKQLKRIEGEYRLLMGEKGVDISDKKYDSLGEYIHDVDGNISPSLRKFLLAYSATALYLIGHIASRDRETFKSDQKKNKYWCNRDANIISGLRISELETGQIYKDCFDALKELYPEGVWTNTFDYVNLLGDLAFIHPLFTEILKCFAEGKRSVEEITDGLAETLIREYGVKVDPRNFLCNLDVFLHQNKMFAHDISDYISCLRKAFTVKYDFEAYLNEMFIVKDKDGRPTGEYGVLDVDILYKKRDEIERVLDAIDDKVYNFEKEMRDDDEYKELFDTTDEIKRNNYNGEYVNPLAFISKFATLLSEAIAEGKVSIIPYDDMKDVLMEVAKLRRFYVSTLSPHLF